MFETDAIHQRGQALEDEFFHRVDASLRAKLRESIQREQAQEELADATGFEDPELLNHLLDAGFQPTSIAALALVPAIFVAWADGSIAPHERQTIMRAALHRGMAKNQAAFHLVEAWMHEPPPQSLWKLWKEYVEAVGDSLAPTLADMLKSEILRHSTAVAEASTGALGIGKVSKQEQTVLDEIARLCAS